MSKLWRDFYDKTVDDPNKQEAFEKAFSSGWDCKEELANQYNKEHIDITGHSVENPLLECDALINELDVTTYDSGC